MTDDYLERIKADDAPDMEMDEPNVTRRIGNIELRYDNKGEIDEILLFAKNGVFHMERMGPRHWWFGLDDDEHDFCMHVTMTLDGLPVPVLATWPDDEEEDKRDVEGDVGA
jgi:hypothetical protein